MSPTVINLGIMPRLLLRLIVSKVVENRLNSLSKKVPLGKSKFRWKN